MSLNNFFKLLTDDGTSLTRQTRLNAKKTAQSNLASADQIKFLRTRIPFDRVPHGTFESFSSLLYTKVGVAIHTNSMNVDRTTLLSVFPDGYFPTYSQLFETIARQTQSSLSFEPQQGYWIFDPPAMPLSYTLDIKDGWRIVNCGAVIKYIPASQPMGMDIYTLGHYTLSERAEDARILNQKQALKMAAGLADLKNMVTAEIAGAEALYLEAPTPRPGVTLRLWSFVKHGQSFVIVSILEKRNEELLLPQLYSMINSVRVLDFQI